MTDSRGLAAFALVAIGGAAGACLRHAAGLWLAHEAWPRATFAVNVTGCFALGLVTGALAGRMPEAWRLLVVVGLLGGFTTFSAFGGETVSLLRSRPGLAAAYALGSVAAAIVAVALGLRLAGMLRR